MQATRRETSRSERQASAQAVQVSTQLKQASMVRLMASEWAGFSGWDRNMARTATADMKSLSFGPPQQNPYGQHWFRDDADEEGMDVSESPIPERIGTVVLCGR
jgi:hypothetical protein